MGFTAPLRVFVNGSIVATVTFYDYVVTMAFTEPLRVFVTGSIAATVTYYDYVTKITPACLCVTNIVPYTIT